MKKISSAHIMLLSIILLQLLMSIVISAFHIPLAMPWNMIVSDVSLLLPFAVYCIVKKQNPLKLIRVKKINFKTIGLALLVLVFSYPVIMLLNMISMLFVDNAMIEMMPSAVSMGLPLGLLLMAVAPAIVEETVFRGALYGTYSRRKPLAGIFLSALIFGLMHMNFNQMPYAFFLGIVMALMLEASDTIITPMIMHFSLNGFSTVVSYLTMGTLSELTKSSSSTDLTELYRDILSSEYSQELSGAQLENMTNQMMGMVIGVLAVIALVCIGIVAALIYVTFVVNHRKPKAILLGNHEDTAQVQGMHGKIRKNRMIDIYLVLFLIYALARCMMSALA